MIDKEMIEEMAQTICEFTHSIGKCDCVNSFAPNCTWKDMATSIYNAGYRKIPKDSVVLSREEYEKLKYAWITDSDAYKKGGNDMAEKIFKELKTRLKDCPEVIEEGYNVQNSVDYFEDIIGYDKFCADEIIKELAKQFGVEIKE